MPKSQNHNTFLILFIMLIIVLIVPVCAEDKVAYIRSKTFSQLKFYPIKKAPAHVTGLSTAILHSEISSIIDQVYVLAGDQVKKGDVLISLNCDDYSFHLIELLALKDEIHANLSLNEYQLARSKKLYKSKNISEIKPM
jgi:multidrug resistance efflux pump